MTTSETEAEGPKTSAPLWVGAALSLAAGAAFFWFVTAEPPLEPHAGHPLDFPPLEVDRKRLESERRERLAGARESVRDAPVDQLHRLMEKLNGLQFPPDGDESKQSKLARKLSIRANEVVPFTGYDGFIAAGEALFRRCDEGLGELLSALRNGTIEVKKARTDPPADSFATYRRACGKFLPTLLDRGLVDSSGNWSEPKKTSRTIAEVLQRLRWATIIGSRRRAILQLTDYEQRLLMRWRIETDAYPMPKRRRYLKQLEQNPSLAPDYDTTLAEAKLAYTAGRHREAARILKSAIRDGDGPSDEYRRRLQWLMKRLEGGDDASEKHSRLLRPHPPPHPPARPPIGRRRA